LSNTKYVNQQLIQANYKLMNISISYKLHLCQISHVCTAWSTARWT